MSTPPTARIGLSEAIRSDPGFGFVERSAVHAAGVFQRTAGLLAAGSPAGMQAELLPQPDRAEDELEHAAVALAGVASAIDHVIVRPRDGMVAWIEMRGEQAELHEAPVDVSVPLAETVFDPAESVILTSATLSVGGSFDFIRKRVGIGATAEELTLPSPFDYLRQAICILPEDATAYDDPAHDLQMTVLIDAIAGRLDGHTLVLFTSYGPLKRVWALLQERLEARGVASLAQGLDGTRRQILQSFLADPRTVLLATSSFWEGIDIPGDRLRCVVIDKLPFPVPTDPLVRARSERLRDPFGEYILPVAIIRLRQGFGRLIRSASDRGAVVLCDPRLRTRQYGLGFLRALPPAPMAVTALDRVPAMVDAFVNSGALPDTVGESVGMVLERSRSGVIPTQESMPDATAADPSPEPAPDPSGSVSVAIAQFYPRLGDVAANVAAHLTVISTAAASGAGLVVFPELSLTGYFLKDQVPEVALRIDAPEIRALQDASRDGGIDIVAGLILESDAHRFFNASALRQRRRGGAHPPQGVPADIRALRRAALSRRRGPIPRLRRAARQPHRASLARGHPHLRGPLAPDVGGAARAPGRGSHHLPVGIARPRPPPG